MFKMFLDIIIKYSVFNYWFEYNAIAEMRMGYRIKYMTLRTEIPKSRDQRGRKIKYVHYNLFKQICSIK